MRGTVWRSIAECQSGPYKRSLGVLSQGSPGFSLCHTWSCWTPVAGRSSPSSCCRSSRQAQKSGWPNLMTPLHVPSLALPPQASLLHFWQACIQPHMPLRRVNAAAVPGRAICPSLITQSVEAARACAAPIISACNTSPRLVGLKYELASFCAHPADQTGPGGLQRLLQLGPCSPTPGSSGSKHGQSCCARWSMLTSLNRLHKRSHNIPPGCSRGFSQALQ